MGIHYWCCLRIATGIRRDAGTIVGAGPRHAIGRSVAGMLLTPVRRTRGSYRPELNRTSELEGSNEKFKNLDDKLALEHRAG